MLSFLKKISPLKLTDAYKLGHAAQYPAGTEMVYSNLTPRSDRLLPIPAAFNDHKIVFFGLQSVLMDLQEFWQENFFDKPVEEVCAEFAAFVPPFVGPSGFNMDRIRELHALGYLPLLVKALPEGSLVPVKVPVLTIRNTEPQFFWLTNYLETFLSAELWKMSTSATIAFAYRKILNHYHDLTGSDPSFALWQGHDFSMRGMSGWLDAAKTGAGHLTSFTGTDGLPSVDFVNHYYGGDGSFIGGSVPATEHSVMCMGGQDDEIGTFRRLISETYPAGIVSIVSDTWDFWQVIGEYAPLLKPEILARQDDDFGNAKVVFRPDSGDPVKIITGYTEDEIIRLEEGIFGIENGVSNAVPLTEIEVKGAVQALWETFGGTETSNGFRTLDRHVGLIYGDSITLDRADQILRRLAAKGFSAANIVFGIGSYTYQHITRDSLGFAVKSTYGTVNGEGREIFKDPKTDNGTKKSARGLLRVEMENGQYVLHDQQSSLEEQEGHLEDVFYNGQLLVNTTISQIRKRVEEQLAVPAIV